MDDVIQFLNSMYSPALDVAWPFFILGVIVLFARRSVRIPGWNDIPLVPTVIGLLGVWVFHGLNWELGVVSSDEVAHLLPSGWTFDYYVRSDAGMPSRLYLAFSWFLLHWQGLAGIRAMILVCATLSALILLVCSRRIHRHWGPWVTLAVLFYYPWLRYNWEARAYPIFLLAICFALWHALQELDSQDRAPRLEAVLLCLAVASIENPICMLIVCAAIQAKVRRYGWKSVSKRTWLLLSLIVMMVVPLVVKAIGAHGGPSQTGVVAVDSRVWILFAVSIPGVWVAGRRGWVAETSVGTLMLFFVGVASGVVPGDQRVMLFAVPWSLAAFLVWIRPTWWTRWYVLPAVLAVALYSDLNHLQYQFNKRSDNVHAARAVFTTLTEAGAERVRFVPKHMRILFLSASFDVRHIQNRYFDQFHPDIPEGYQSTEAPRCDAGEFVVEWHRSSPTCDCLLIANEYPWRAYHCTTSDGTSEE